jgi:hypothetical protein
MSSGLSSEHAEEEGPGRPGGVKRVHAYGASGFVVWVVVFGFRITGYGLQGSGFGIQVVDSISLDAVLYQ